MDVTAKLAQFAVSVNYATIPGLAIETSKVAIRDCLGVALGGSKEEDARIAAQIAKQENAKEETSVIGQGFKTSALNAALANGTAAHALDFDHSFTWMGQPMAPIIPAIFALSEALGASGRQVIEAHVVGYEITGKLVHSLRETTHDAWHGPSSVGVFGASAACAKLIGLTTAQTEMALGIAASFASGLHANFGTMTKPLHVGHGARNGVLAAKLAQAGFTANPKAIEHSLGYYAAYHRGAPINERPFAELGQSYALVTDSPRIKPYPCGALTHEVIDSILELRAEIHPTADMIDSIGVNVSKHIFDRIAFRIPQTGIQGKFSMPYLVARALIDGKVSLHAFTEEAVRDVRVLKLAERVQMNLDTTLKKIDDAARPCRVTVRLKDGRSFTRQKQHSKGGPEFPMTEDELRDKFAGCAQAVLSESSIQKVLHQIERLETLTDVRPLCEMLQS